MKVHTGYLELVIIIALMIACVPLLCTLMYTCNSTKMSYLDDKTIYKMSDSVTWETATIDGRQTLVPSTLAPISIDYGGAQIIAVVNDDYCPEDGKVIHYDYDSSSIYSSFNASTDAVLKITDGWKALKSKAWSEQLSLSLNSSLRDKQMYLVWNAETKCWMIAPKPAGGIINVFEVR